MPVKLPTEEEEILAVAQEVLRVLLLSTDSAYVRYMAVKIVSQVIQKGEKEG